MERRRDVRTGPAASSREASHRVVLESLAIDGSRSRADLGRALGISPASISRAVDGLLGADLVREGARLAARIGRPQTLLEVNPAAAVVVGVSVRSRFVRLLLAGLDGAPLHRLTLERAPGPPAELARQLRGLVTEVRRAHAPERDVGAVVVGISGAWDARRRRVHAAPDLPGYEGVDLVALLQDSLCDLVVGCAIDLDNDVNLAALGERAHGSARGEDDFFYLSLGTGVGGAAVIDGRLHRGAHGFAGEVGFLPVVDGGRLQPIEAVVGRKGLERRAAEAGPLGAEDDVFALLEVIDDETNPVVDHVLRHLASALVAVITTLDPRLIVLGGGIGRTRDVWAARVRVRLKQLVPQVPAIVTAALGRDASLLGAVVHGTALARSALLADRVSG
jgi:predicted NBD/HSP70 family sugar kinase